MWMLDEAPEQYRIAQRSALIQRIVEADIGLEDAATPLDIARAREVARFSRWDAERRLPQLFGDKQGAQTGNITVVIRTLSGQETTVTIGQGERQIDAEPVLVLDHQPDVLDAAERVLDGGKPECA